MIPIDDTFWNGISEKAALVFDTGIPKEKVFLFCEEGKRAGKTLSLFPLTGGELAKTPDTVNTIHHWLLESQADRNTTLIAMGGGVTTDLVGYAASTYMRGIPLAFVPTTLLAMVDAAIGGKNGVNSTKGKNHFGTFYAPKFIGLDLSFLDSLSKEQMHEGIAEMVKHAAIAHPQMLENLKDFTAVGSLVAKSASIKEKIVAADPKEEGLRKILNFGHTLGHAIETLSNYQVSHGRAVAWGMHFAAALSHHMCALPKEEMQQLQAICELIGGECPLIDPLKAWEVMKTDKKGERGEPHFVLLEALGKPASFGGRFCQKIEHSEFMDVFHEWHQNLPLPK